MARFSLKIVLSEHERKVAEFIGKLRRSESVKRQNKYVDRTWPSGKAQTREQIDICAAGSEIAAAKQLDHFWTMGVNVAHEQLCDVLPDLEVRWTAYPNGHLIIGGHLHEDRPYILLTGGDENFDYDMRGWLRGRDVPRVGEYRWWNGAMAWWVEQRALRQNWNQRRERRLHEED